MRYLSDDEYRAYEKYVAVNRKRERRKRKVRGLIPGLVLVLIGTASTLTGDATAAILLWMIGAVAIIEGLRI